MISQKVKEIDFILAQTQCTKCGYDDCLSYAKAINRGTAHNQCPPAGDKGIQELSILLGRDYMPLNPKNGQEKDREIAVIDEDLCIGCTKCIDACPVDAILGAPKQMHYILNNDCTGCELCIEPCPMDCISMEKLPSDKQFYNYPLEKLIQEKDYFREKHNQKLLRVQEEKNLKNKSYEKNKSIDKKDYIKNAMLNFKSKKKKKLNFD